ncbi:NAD(P)-binding domain-containing protein [Artemisia annua]|uniref:NAD(P)-binding domain-containing protein n=1 Tax=Artemisia annua TaxID=35608 RepID=A0A2U1P209_ARTAN|nr:NAD(P)-binding domain-containing protein [Artemisia annua]
MAISDNFYDDNFCGFNVGVVDGYSTITFNGGVEHMKGDAGGVCKRTDKQEVMDLVAKSGKFDPTFVGFTGKDGVLGKRLDNSKTREEIGWEPKYKSFAHCLGVAE